MQPLNSSVHTEHSTFKHVSGDFVYAGDFRICRYDATRRMLYFWGPIAKVEYAISFDDFGAAISLPPMVPAERRVYNALRDIKMESSHGSNVTHGRAQDAWHYTGPSPIASAY